MSNDLKWWLGLCGLIGIVFFAALLSGGGGLPAGAVARVNGVAVSGGEASGTVSRNVSRNAHHSAGDIATRIDDELLVQEGLALDLAHKDQRVRSTLLLAMNDVAIQGHPLTMPIEAQLIAHYKAHPDHFSQPNGLHLRRIAFSENGESVKRAWQNSVDAYRRLAAGDDFLKVRRELGDTDPIAIPDQLIALAQLRALLGVDMTLSVLRLRAGEISRPVEEHGFIFIVQMLRRDVPMLPTFAVVRPEVLVDYQRSERKAVLARYLAPLRARAHIVTR